MEPSLPTNATRLTITTRALYCLVMFVATSHGSLAIDRASRTFLDVCPKDGES